MWRFVVVVWKRGWMMVPMRSWTDAARYFCHAHPSPGDRGQTPTRGRLLGEVSLGEIASLGAGAGDERELQGRHAIVKRRHSASRQRQSQVEDLGDLCAASNGQ